MIALRAQSVQSSFVPNSRAQAPEGDRSEPTRLSPMLSETIARANQHDRDAPAAANYGRKICGRTARPPLSGGWEGLWQSADGTRIPRPSRWRLAGATFPDRTPHAGAPAERLRSFRIGAGSADATGTQARLPVETRSAAWYRPRPHCIALHP